MGPSMVGAYHMSNSSSATTITRRGAIGAIAVGLAGLAGCADSEEMDDPSDNGNHSDDGDSNGHDGNGDANGEEGFEREIPDRDIEPDWEEAAAFRTWLTDADPFNGGNRRFDYTEEFPEGTDFGSVFPEYFEVSSETVDAHLIQSLTQVFFGSFDQDAILAGVEDDDEYEFVEEYEGFAVIDAPIPNTAGRRDIAVGESAIVIGPDYEERIDAHRGSHDRLEDIDQEFTHLFRQFPHRTTLTGEYNAPEGSDVSLDEIYIWGVSSESPMADTMTWVFILEEGAEPTDDIVAELEGISDDVHDTEVEGRTVTITGGAPNVSPGPDE
ncbi:hypothetical protein [Natrialba hulunbeirensis]|nr:hypothetical protein [Natrialba hulunbeirensis]